MKKLFNFILGIIVGGMAGALIAILFAPESGENLRGKLRDGSSGFIGEIRSAVAQRRKALEDRLAELSNPYTSEDY